MKSRTKSFSEPGPQPAGRTAEPAGEPRVLAIRFGAHQRGTCPPGCCTGRENLQGEQAALEASRTFLRQQFKNANSKIPSRARAGRTSAFGARPPGSAPRPPAAPCPVSPKEAGESPRSLPAGGPVNGPEHAECLEEMVQERLQVQTGAGAVEVLTAV